MLLAGCFTASAQQQEAATKEVFNPHWFVQAQIGGQYTLGEVCFGDLLSGNAQIAGGYQFSPVWAVRLAIGAWQSKGGSDLSYMDLGVNTWKWNYIAPTVDVTCNLTNWILGYNPKRVVDAGLIAGIGTNISWNNDKASTLQQLVDPTATADEAHYMSLLWSGSKARVVGQFGACWLIFLLLKCFFFVGGQSASCKHQQDIMVHQFLYGLLLTDIKRIDGVALVLHIEDIQFFVKNGTETFVSSKITGLLLICIIRRLVPPTCGEQAY